MQKGNITFPIWISLLGRKRGTEIITPTAFVAREPAACIACRPPVRRDSAAGRRVYRDWKRAFCERRPTASRCKASKLYKVSIFSIQLLHSLFTVHMIHTERIEDQDPGFEHDAWTVSEESQHLLRCRQMVL